MEGAFRFRSILDILHEEGVEFIVVGGQAEALFGSPRPTYDADLCYRRTSDNLERLARALRRIEPKLRGAPPDLSFVIDSRSLAIGSNFTLSTPYGDLDLLGWIDPLGTYEQLLPKIERWTINEHEVKVIGLEDLIRVKEHINRPKDRESLLQLRAIKRLREEEGLR